MQEEMTHPANRLSTRLRFGTTAAAWTILGASLLFTAASTAVAQTSIAVNSSAQEASTDNPMESPMAIAP